MAQPCMVIVMESPPFASVQKQLLNALPVPWVAPPPHVNPLLSARIPELFLVGVCSLAHLGGGLGGGAGIHSRG